jgi:hypothetical protein
MLKLSATIDALARWFRDVNYSAEQEAAAMRYAQHRHAMLFGAGQELPSIQKVRSDEAMTLVTGNVYERGLDGYGVSVGEEGRGSILYTVYGNSPEQVEARARQLVSALDGARRL